MDAKGKELQGSPPAPSNNRVTVTWRSVFYEEALPAGADATHTGNPLPREDEELSADRDL